MKVLDLGHHYHLEVYDKGHDHEDLMFMKRVGERYPGNIQPSHGGTNCQEVLRALIDRLKYLNEQIACSETEICIGHARHMILLLEQRAKRVKGKHLSAPLEMEIECYPTCKTCGHILCTEDHHH